MMLFSPVRVDPSTLRLVLRGLETQSVDEFVFYDDNEDPESSAILADWCASHAATILPPMDGLPSGKYERTDYTHVWDASSIARVASIKNDGIRHFLESEHESLLLWDADLVPGPGTVAHLYEADLPVVCAVFWTAWKPGRSGPNVWDFHQTEYRKDLGGYERFRIPDHYEVGGLGAATLIRREVLSAGVNFTAVPGVLFWGEDRHFCIRAAVHGFPLTACSHVDVRHVYRPEDVEPIGEWVDSWTTSLSPAS